MVALPLHLVIPQSEEMSYPTIGSLRCSARGILVRNLKPSAPTIVASGRLSIPYIDCFVRLALVVADIPGS